MELNNECLMQRVKVICNNGTIIIGRHICQEPILSLYNSHKNKKNINKAKILGPQIEPPLLDGNYCEKLELKNFCFTFFSRLSIYRTQAFS